MQAKTVPRDSTPHDRRDPSVDVQAREPTPESSDDQRIPEPPRIIGIEGVLIGVGAPGEGLPETGAQLRTGTFHRMIIPHGQASRFLRAVTAMG